MSAKGILGSPEVDAPEVIRLRLVGSELGENWASKKDFSFN
jgi:hypothetical protein